MPLARLNFSYAALALIVVIGAIFLVSASSTEAYNGAAQYSFKDDDCKTISDPTTLVFYGSYAKTRLIAGDARFTRFPNRQGKKSIIAGEFQGRTGWRRHSTDNIFKQPILVYGRQSGNRDCRKNPDNTDLASASGYGNDRWHTRMWDLGGPGTPGVVATPHREDWYWSRPGRKCATKSKIGALPLGSHAVERGARDRGPQNYERHGSGFDRGRRTVVQAFRKDYVNVTGHRIFYRNFGNTRSVKQCDGEYAGSNGQVGYIKLGR